MSYPSLPHTGHVSSRVAGGAAPLIGGASPALRTGAPAFHDPRPLDERLTQAGETGAMAVWFDQPAIAPDEIVFPARTVLVALVAAACLGMLAGAALIHAHGSLARALS